MKQWVRSFLLIFFRRKTQFSWWSIQQFSTKRDAEGKVEFYTTNKEISFKGRPVHHPQWPWICDSHLFSEYLKFASPAVRRCFKHRGIIWKIDNGTKNYSQNERNCFRKSAQLGLITLYDEKISRYRCSTSLCPCMTARLIKTYPAASSWRKPC